MIHMFWVEWKWDNGRLEWKRVRLEWWNGGIWNFESMLFGLALKGHQTIAQGIVLCKSRTLKHKP
jgi:hypothetical protein